MRTFPGLEDVERLFTLNGLFQQIHLLIRTTYLTQSWHEAVESLRPFYGIFAYILQL